MLWVDKDDDKWVTSAYFEYPNEDLCDRREELNDPREMIKLMNDLLEAMAYLQRHKMVHGDIRPEYIFYNRHVDKYVLLDRLIDASPANEAQMNNIFYQDKTLYASPVLFNELCQGNLKIKHNPFKSEVFSLGMVLISLFVEEAELMRCYNRRLKEFDYREFTVLTEHLRDSVFVGDLEDLFGEYLFLCILNLNEKERLSPKKALKILRKGICEALNKMDDGVVGEMAVEEGSAKEDETGPVEAPLATLGEGGEVQAGETKEDKSGESLDSGEGPKDVVLGEKEVSPETQQMWDQYLQAKEKIQGENPTERDSEQTGQSQSQKSHEGRYVNHEQLNMPNLGGDLVVKESGTSEEPGHQDTMGEDEEDVVGSLPTNFTSELLITEEMEKFNRSQSAVEFENLHSDSKVEKCRLGDLKTLVDVEGKNILLIGEMGYVLC